MCLFSKVVDFPDLFKETAKIFREIKQTFLKTIFGVNEMKSCKLYLRSIIRFKSEI